MIPLVQTTNTFNKAYFVKGLQVVTNGLIMDNKSITDILYFWSKSLKKVSHHVYHTNGQFDHLPLEKALQSIQRKLP